MVDWFNNPGNSRENKARAFWWKESEKDISKVLWDVISKVCEATEFLDKMDLHHARLYGNEEFESLDPYGYTTKKRRGQHVEGMSFNICESAVDTLHSEIISKRTRPYFLTEGGNWAQRKRAQGLTQFCAGQFHESRVYRDVSSIVAREGIALGTAAAKVYLKNGRPRAERVPISEIKVDPVEAFYGKINSMFHVRKIPREVALSAWPKHKDKIKEIPRISPDNHRYDTSVDLVEVREAWHLATDKDKTDGRHVILLEDLVVVDEKYDRKTFPFAFFRCKERLYGWRGKGIVQVLRNSQYAINYLLYRMHKKLHRWGNMLFVDHGTKLAKSNVSNSDDEIYETSSPPHLIVPQSIPTDMFQEVERLKQEGFSLVGINMMAASSEIPNGIEDNAKAMRFYADTKSKRFKDLVDAFDQFHMDLAELFIELTREAYENLKAENEDYEVLCPDEAKHSADIVKWSEVDLPEDKYIMRVFPASFFSSTPSGQLAEIEQFIKIFPDYQEVAPSLLDFPDLKSITKLVTSSTESARRMIERILETGTYESPEPFMDLQKTLKLAQNYYLDARADGAPEANLEKLREFMTATHELLKQAQPPQGVPPNVQPGPVPTGS